MGQQVRPDLQQAAELGWGSVRHGQLIDDPKAMTVGQCGVYCDASRQAN
jgi:hypothetical protein